MEEKSVREQIYRILVENKVSKSKFKDIVEFINVCYDGKAFFEKEEDKPSSEKTIVNETHSLLTEMWLLCFSCFSERFFRIEKANKKSTQRVQRKYYYRTIIALIIL